MLLFYIIVHYLLLLSILWGALVLERLFILGFNYRREWHFFLKNVHWVCRIIALVGLIQPTKLAFSLVLLGRQSDTFQFIMPKMIRGRLKQACVLLNCFWNTNDCWVKHKQSPTGKQISSVKPVKHLNKPKHIVDFLSETLTVLHLNKADLLANMFYKMNANLS